MKKALLFAFMAALLLVPTVAFALDSDTASGVLITAPGTENLLQYKDVGMVLQPTAESSTITVEVTAMYGLREPLADYGTVVTTAGLVKTYDYIITNEGNNSSTFTISVDATLSNGANTWTVELYDGSNLLVSRTSTGVISTTEVLTEDEDRLLTVKVTPNSDPTKSPNGSYTTAVFRASTANTPVGYYLGANANQYGGAASASDSAITTIESSVMTITRTATVDSPTAYITNGGGAHDAVPGAVITYKINYNNTGASSAESVIIIDKVPNDTTAGHMMGASGTLTNVTITSLPTSSTGYSVYYSTSATPSRDYGNATGWTSTSVGTDLHGISGITYVKFEKASVAVAETKDLTWGVIIK
jgi:uncharacterized repeat protein (TIGR01451 family)